VAAPLPQLPPLKPWEARDPLLEALVTAVRELQEASPSGGAPVASGSAETYPSMTQAQALSGASTKAMVVSPKVLKALVTKIVEEKLAELTS